MISPEALRISKRCRTPCPSTLILRLALVDVAVGDYATIAKVQLSAALVLRWPDDAVGG